MPDWSLNTIMWAIGWSSPWFIMGIAIFIMVICHNCGDPIILKSENYDRY